MQNSDSDSILVRCPKCRKWFQPDQPLVADDLAWWAEILLEEEGCSQHEWTEVIVPER